MYTTKVMLLRPCIVAGHSLVRLQLPKRTNAEPQCIAWGKSDIAVITSTSPSILEIGGGVSRSVGLWVRPDLQHLG
jgi:hypothetical protein